VGHVYFDQIEIVHVLSNYSMSFGKKFLMIDKFIEKTL